jgi:hypothetical protein
MRQYRALLRGQGTSIVDLYWAGCIINMSGFDLRQAQDRKWPDHGQNDAIDPQRTSSRDAAPLLRGRNWPASDLGGLMIWFVEMNDGR